MFIIKNNYYLYIENTKSINLDCLKKNVKITIIYRNNGTHENYTNLYKFRQKCRLNKFKIYIANDIKLAKYIKADGLYLSSYNKKVYSKLNLALIGSAHNYREIYQKIKQGCSTIILSRLFKTSYKNKKSYLGIIKYNLMVKNLGYKIKRRQDAPKVYDLNASIYIWKRKTLISKDTLFVKKNSMYIMPNNRGYEVDTESDFKIVSYLMKNDIFR